MDIDEVFNLIEDSDYRIELSHNDVSSETWFVRDEQGNISARSIIGRSSEVTNKRAEHDYMDMYFAHPDNDFGYSFGDRIDATVRNSIASQVAESFYETVGDCCSDTPEYKEYYSTVCLGMFNKRGTRGETAKFFLNGYSDFSSGKDEVYSGIDPCWDYEAPPRDELK